MWARLSTEPEMFLHVAKSHPLVPILRQINSHFNLPPWFLGVTFLSVCSICLSILLRLQQRSSENKTCQRLPGRLIPWMIQPKPCINKSNGWHSVMWRHHINYNFMIQKSQWYADFKLKNYRKFIFRNFIHFDEIYQHVTLPTCRTLPRQFPVKEVLFLHASVPQH